MRLCGTTDSDRNIGSGSGTTSRAGRSQPISMTRMRSSSIPRSASAVAVDFDTATKSERRYASHHRVLLR